MSDDTSDIFNDSGGTGFQTSTQMQTINGDLNNFSTEAIVNGSFNENPWGSPIISNEVETSYNKEFPLINKANTAKSKDSRDYSLFNNVTSNTSISGGSSTRNQTSQEDSTQSQVLIIEPSGTNEDIKKFFNNDLHIALAIDNSPIKQLDIKNVRKNMSRKIMIIHHEKNDPELIQQCLSLKTLGKFKITCRLPVALSKVYGVIGPIGFDTDLESLKEALTTQCDKIVKVDRIIKGKDKQPTLFVKIEFNQDSLPEHLKVGYQRYKVKAYVAPPWQCYKCQGFGHNAAQCRFKPRCLVCAGPHQYKDCTHKGSRTTTPSCPNCKGNHAANFGGCPYFKRAKIVERVRATEKISYRDAVRQVDKEQNDSSSNSNTVNASNNHIRESHLPLSGANSVKVTNKMGNNKPNVSRISSSSQTDEQQPCNCKGSMQCFDQEQLLKGISKLIAKILSAHLTNVSEKSITDVVLQSKDALFKVPNPPEEQQTTEQIRKPTHTPTNTTNKDNKQTSRTQPHLTPKRNDPSNLKLLEQCKKLDNQPTKKNLQVENKTRNKTKSSGDTVSPSNRKRRDRSPMGGTTSPQESRPNKLINLHD